MSETLYNKPDLKLWRHSIHVEIKCKLCILQKQEYDDFCRLLVSSYTSESLFIC